MTRWKELPADTHQAMKAYVISLCALVGCVAPPKNVGVESETASESETKGTPVGGCAEATDEETCLSIDVDGDAMCGWFRIQTIDASPDECGFMPDRFACLESTYYGDGCGIPAACGDEGLPVAFRPTDDEGTYELIEGVCGFDVAGFTDYCGGDDDPYACSCVCPVGGPSLPPAWQEELTEQGGCADLFVYAAYPAGSLALSLRVDGMLVAAVVDSGEASDTQLDAADVELRLELGTNVDMPYCNDAIDPDETMVDASWTAVAGVVDIHLEPGDNDDAVATVTFTDVEFAPDQAENGSNILPSFTIEDVLVGWLPG